jgi:chromosome segregation ATPase
MLGRVRTTLRALAFGDAEGRERLRAGRVLAEATGTGLNSLEALSPLGSRASLRSDRRPKRERQREEKERERALAAARREAQAAERDLARASAVVARLRHEAEDAQARANEKKQQSRDAEGELAQVARRVEDVRRRVAELEGGSPA